MPTDNVRLFPGVCRPEMEGDVPPQRVLRAALDCGPKDVAIVVRRIDGGITAFGSAADIDTTVGLLVRGANWLSAAPQVPAEDEDKE